MTTLKTSYQHPDYVSDVFEGGVMLFVEFQKEGINNVVIETRLDETLSWVQNRNQVIAKSGHIALPSSADGQQFRVRCKNEILNLQYTKLNGNSGHSGGGSDDEEVINPDDIETIGPDAAKDLVNDAISQIEGGGSNEQNHENQPEPTQEAGAGEDEVDGGGSELPEE